MDSRVCTVADFDAVLTEMLGEYVGDCAEAVARGVKTDHRAPAGRDPRHGPGG